MRFSPLNVSPVAIATLFFFLAVAHAQENSEEFLESMNLPEVEVKEEALDRRIYSREEMDATASGNRDIATLLETHPAVRLNPLAKNGNRGSLAVEDFSIHGESPYQNQFLIDGISGVNMISPQEEASGSLSINKVVGFSQSYNIDTDVLDSIEVLDNRVPIEYGKFQGGVVSAKIKNPRGSNKFSLKRGFNSSGLTEQKISENLNEEWVDGEPGYAAEWKKYFSGFSGDVRINEKTNALIAYSYRESLINRKTRKLDLSLPNPSLDNSYYETEQEKDSVANLMLKFRTSWSASTHSNILLKYADRKEDLVGLLFSNENWTNRQDARGLAFELEKKTDFGSLDFNIGLDDLDSKRESDSYEQVVQQFMAKDSGGTSVASKNYTYGGLGDAALKQRQYVVKSKFMMNPFKTMGLQHNLYFGIDLQKTTASFERERDVHIHTYRKRPNGTQEHYKHHIYKAGQVGVDYGSLAMYASDTVLWRNFSLTAAARVDKDNFLKNTNLSPRARIDWNMGGRDETFFGVGWSRYYGMDIIGYALDEGKDKLFYHVIHEGNEKNEYVGYTGRSFDNLKTPSSDEFVISAEQRIGNNFAVDLSYVSRKSKNEISQDGSKAKGYFKYTNTGSGEVRSIALSLKTIHPLNFAGAIWNTRVDYSRQKINRSQDSTLGWSSKGLLPDDVITVDGVQMLRRNKPASIFDQPERLSVGLSGKWQSLGFTWGNRLNWMSSKEQLVATNTNFNVYKTYDIPSFWTWDTSFTYKPKANGGVFLNIDILNALNKIPVNATTRSGTSYSPQFETGREIWLNIGYEF